MAHIRGALASAMWLLFATLLPAGSSFAVTAGGRNVSEPEAELVSPAAEVGGDPYLWEVQADCETTGASWSCTKAKLLRLAVGAARSPRQVQLWGPLSLTPLEAPLSPTPQPPLFPSSEPRSEDSEADKTAKFALRMLERYARSHALRFDLGPSDAVLDRRESYSEGRGKKKKAAILLPIILFLKLKALLVPTLLAVLFIKKLLVLAAIFLPALLHYIKICKMPHHNHHAVAYHLPHGDWSGSGVDNSASGGDASAYGGSPHYATRKQHLSGGRRAAYRRQRY